MKPLTISLIIFACVFGSAPLGMTFRRMIPEHDFDSEAKDVIKLGLGLVITMNALVLGLLISTAKSSYDSKRAQVAELAADALLADRSLALYGPETKEARIALQELVSGLMEQMKSMHDSGSQKQPAEWKANATDFYQIVRKLTPRGDEQAALKAEVLRISLEVARIRATALTRDASSIPRLFLVVLVFWLVILFIGLGLFAPPNFTVLAALCICAFSVAAAFFLVIDMDDAFSGIMRISNEPLRNALMVICK